MRDSGIDKHRPQLAFCSQAARVMALHRPAWRCAGCLCWNWQWRVTCRGCGPHVNRAECYSIGGGDGDDALYEEEFFPSMGFKSADVPNGLTGSAWGDWALSTGPPLRAFESESGMQDQVGFFDPAGFTEDGIAKHLASRRQTVLMHGRFAACTELIAMSFVMPAGPLCDLCSAA